MPARLRLLPLALVALACQQSPEGTPPVSPGPGSLQTLPITRLNPNAPVLSQISGYTAPTRTVIDNDADWGTAWDRIYQNLSPKPPLPTVDFRQSMVVLAALGPRPTGGFSVTIDSVSVTAAGELQISVQESAPGGTCVSVTVLTSPVDAVIIPKRSEPPVFQVHSAMRDCR